MIWVYKKKRNNIDEHIKLTDGNSVSNKSKTADSKWVILDKDRNTPNFPKNSFALGEIAPWGWISSQGVYVSDTDPKFNLLMDANIKHIRINADWGYIQGRNPTEVSWADIFDPLINNARDYNCSLQVNFSYSPDWAVYQIGANHSEGQLYFPFRPTDNINIDFTSNNTQNLPNTYISQTVEQSVIITPQNTTYTTISETLPYLSNYTRYARKTSKPIKIYPKGHVDAEKVEVNLGSGWETWERVDTFINMPELDKKYLVHRDGWIRFRDNSRWFPAAGPTYNWETAQVRITYKTPDTIYTEGLHYSLDIHTGQIIRTATGNISSNVIANETFNSTLDTNIWKWRNIPNNITIGSSTINRTGGDDDWNETATVLKFDATQASAGDYINNMLYQEVNIADDFEFKVRLWNASIPRYAGTNGSVDTGVCIYQDDNNWIRLCVTGFYGQLIYQQKINGVLQNAQELLGHKASSYWYWSFPYWLCIRRKGNNWYLYETQDGTTASDQNTVNLTQTFTGINSKIKVGIFAVANNGLSNHVEIDRAILNFPYMEQLCTASYDYLYFDDWKNFISQSVIRYKDKVKHWEFWNEPDGFYFRNYGKGINDKMKIACKIMSEGINAAKAADPTCVCIPGGLSDSAIGFTQFYYDNIGKDKFERLSWHPYLFTRVAPMNKYINWGSNNSGMNYAGRVYMINNADKSTKVNLGEVAAIGGVSTYNYDSGYLSEYPNTRNTMITQAEFGFYLMAMTKRFPYVESFNWWPAADLEEVGNREDFDKGGHEGLFFMHDGSPKPIYWIYRNVGTNKGFLIDLITYDPDTNDPVPSNKKYTIKKIVIGANNLNPTGCVIKKSLTGIDTSCKPNRVPGYLQGSRSNDFVFNVNVNVNSNPAAGKWILECTQATGATPAQFIFLNPSGVNVGSATAGTLFSNSNFSFTIPTNSSYSVGYKLEFEVYSFDGWTTLYNSSLSISTGVWSVDGSGNQVYTFNNGLEPDVRYLSIEFARQDTSKNLLLDEIQVLLANNTNVALNKYYLIEGCKK